MRTFNDLFGNIDWKDEDKVRQVIAEELPTKIGADPAYQNAIRNSDKQNARIEHDNALHRALVGLVTDHIELFKQFQDNSSFRKWLSDTLFAVTYRPEYRALDDDISRIELALRALIENALEGNRDLLPSHLKDKAHDRIKRITQREPTKSESDFQSMTKLLEFFDLRELEAVVVSKVCWDRFAEKIKNKELFQKRFWQLAEIRNALRHNRSVDEITQKEGEASVLWFKELLNVNGLSIQLSA